MRKIKFQTGQYYHIYNRGIEKRDIFCDAKDYVRFLIGMREFNRLEPIESLYRLNQIREKEKIVEVEPLYRGSTSTISGLVEILAYCLNKNHYHLLVKQIDYKGIEKFMHKLSTSYTMYFNKRYNRSGSLFQGRYKAIHANTDSYLLRLSCYINGNAEIHKIAKDENYQWSSYPDYLEKRNGTLCNKKIILNQFKNIEEYKNLVYAIIKETGDKKDELKKYLLE